MNTQTLLLFTALAYPCVLLAQVEQDSIRYHLPIVTSVGTELMHGEQYLAPLIKKTLSEGRSFRGKSVNLNLGAINMDFNLSPYFLRGRIEGAVLSSSENLNIAEKENYDVDPLDYLMGSIAHEIKNPLGGIKGAAQLLLGRVKDASLDENTSLIIKETDRLNAILNDYLIICKKPSFSSVNIHEVVEKALSLMSVHLKNGRISVKKLYDPSLPPVKGDDSKLLQVFLNIIKNAIESMKKERQIGGFDIPLSRVDQGRRKDSRRWRSY